MSQHRMNLFRMPNLGGLCRTCEIFGVGKMTIPSSAALKDKDFTGISVTAEQWIPLEEVSEPNLPEYLTTLKKEGWAVVAIEQEIKINTFFIIKTFDLSFLIIFRHVLFILICTLNRLPVVFL